MAKLMTMFLILIAIQACLLIYAAPNSLTTDLWTFVTNMDNWNNIDFILALVGIAGAIGLTGIVAGTMFGFKTDFLIFAPAVAGLLSMGVVFTQLASTMRSELISRFFPTCDLSNCGPVTFIIAITIGPIALYYAWTVIEWWRGKDY